MPSERIRELLDLIAVQDFYMGLIKNTLGHAVPMPQETTEAASLDDRMDHAILVLRRWLALLDLAISPPMVRDALKESTSHETAEALLRYYILKTSRTAHGRDKADFVATFLYRLTAADAGHHASDLTARFEKVLKKVLAGLRPPDLPPEHRQLVAEFDFLRQEVDSFHHFDALMDSGMVQRVRDIKKSLRDSFYHPKALAAIAAYNAHFGRCFDQLFRQAAQQIKDFAVQVQQEGTGAMSPVEDDVTVQHLEEAGEAGSVLDLEYGGAQEHFRKVSRLKKVVDQRTPARAAGASSAARVPPAFTHNPVEEGKINALVETIRGFNRAATDSRGSVIVPLPHGNAVLSAAEAEAYRAEFHGEKSFRADCAHALVRMSALEVRMAAESREFHAKKGSTQYLWKPHADALAYLLAAAWQELETAAGLILLAQQQGLADQGAAMRASAEKLRHSMQEVAAALQM